eukprot:scaffold7700_cov140-Skeletonema_dohrnii-CCMP3373.AAC.5
MANYNGSLEAVDCHIHSVRYVMVLESRAGGRLRCLIRSPTTLQRRRYNQTMLEPCVRYDMVLESRTSGRLRCLIRSPASSGHLRRCSDADTIKQCLSRGKDASIPSWPTIMGH